ncbi:lipopolysaccharide biosynthesis protein [Rhodohalobacter sp.]|uniref:lipopolysaccharide biosynthesis protein n=1 Tax=Rhodohalobacter sp. TaxID=1974210 RepID=UPI002ACD7D16|nr:oligosaccharide flippase family protein [Rhodohalobacter sp.]MDZ7758184.1 oligosaccharide flippase family protein [Rhodohalobacter sp.]
MGIIAKQSFWNSLITYVGISLGFVLTIFLYPHILNPDQYGLTRVMVSAALILSQFAHLGFQNLILRYFPFFKNASPKKHGFLFWALTVPLGGFLLFTILFFLFDELLISVYDERSPLFVDYYLWLLPLTLFVLYFEVLNNYLRSLRDSTTGSIVNEVSQRLFAILFLGFYFFGWISFAQFVALFVLSYASQPMIILAQIIRKKEFQIKPNFRILKKPLVKGMANYSLYSLLGGLTTVLVWNVDVLMLGSMAGLESTAIYAIAFYIGSVIAVPQRSIDKIATPLISDFIKQKKWGEVDKIYKKTSLNQLILGLTIFGIVWLNVDLLFTFLPEIYQDGKWVVFIIGIGKLIDIGNGSNGVILLNSKHYRVSFYTNIILVLVTIGANYLLIPQYGIEGAAIASAGAIFIYNGVKYLYVKFRMKMTPFTIKTVVVLFLGAVALYISGLSNFGFENLWISGTLKSLIYLALFVAPLLYYRVSEDIHQLIFNSKKEIENESITGQ